MLNDHYLAEIEQHHYKATDLRRRRLASDLLALNYSVTDVIGFLDKVCYYHTFSTADLEAIRRTVTITKYADLDREIHRLQYENAYMKEQLLAETILTEIYKNHQCQVFNSQKKHL